MAPGVKGRGIYIPLPSSSLRSSPIPLPCAHATRPATPRTPPPPRPTSVAATASRASTVPTPPRAPTTSRRHCCPAAPARRAATPVPYVLRRFPRYASCLLRSISRLHRDQQIDHDEEHAVLACSISDPRADQTHLIRLQLIIEDFTSMNIKNSDVHHKKKDLIGLVEIVSTSLTFLYFVYG